MIEPIKHTKAVRNIDNIPRKVYTKILVVSSTSLLCCSSGEKEQLVVLRLLVIFRLIEILQLKIKF